MNAPTPNRPTRTRPVTDWRIDAACVDVDPETFFPLDDRPTSAGVRKAKTVCAGCPVRDLCLADTLANETTAMRWGVSGGLAPAERVQVARRQRPEAA